MDPEEIQRAGDAVELEIADQAHIVAAAQNEFERARDAAEAVGREVREEQSLITSAEAAHRIPSARRGRRAGGGRRGPTGGVHHGPCRSSGPAARQRCA